MHAEPSWRDVMFLPAPMPDNTLQQVSKAASRHLPFWAVEGEAVVQQLCSSDLQPLQRGSRQSACWTETCTAVDSFEATVNS